MERENQPRLPDAHQQIRLGDIQAAGQKYTVANEHYSRAIEYFQAIQKDLKENSLIAIIQAQIVQCEKTIHYCRLKHQAEQASKTEHQPKIARTQSVSRLNSSGAQRGKLTRRNTINLQNTEVTTGRDGTDSLTAWIFQNNSQKKSENPKLNPPKSVMRKITKNDSQKMEELQMSNESYKDQLVKAMDLIQKLENERNELLSQQASKSSESRIHFDLPSTNEDEDEYEDEQESEGELEATI